VRLYSRNQNDFKKRFPVIAQAVAALDSVILDGEIAALDEQGGTHRSKDMIEHTLDKAHSILYVRPQSKLEQGDFVQLAKTVDPHMEERGTLAGLIIETTAFPGWESLGAMASHFRFVRDHHKHIKDRRCNRFSIGKCR